ncbi:MAG: hypothetical protein ABIJ45_02310 [Candidatus Zixiibacteriota bacterium]
MFKIEAQDYGYKLIFSGTVNAAEIKRWLAVSEKILENQTSGFCLLIDTRGMEPFDNDTKVYMEKGQELFKEKGLERVAIIIDNPAIKMQFKHIAIRIGTYGIERYINSACDHNWEQMGIDWLENANDPNTQSQKIQLSKLKF